MQTKIHPILAGSIVILVLTIGGMFLYVQQLNKKVVSSEINAQTIRKDLKVAYTKLDSISAALDVQITEISNLKGNVDSLLKIKQQLEVEKYQIRLVTNGNPKKYQDIMAKITNYESMLLQKSQQIESLRQENETLKEENEYLKDSLNLLSTKKSESKPHHWKAKSIQIQGMDKLGGLYVDSELKTTIIDKLKIHFKLADRHSGQSQSSTDHLKIYIRLLAPSDHVLFDASAASGKFICEGEQKLFTSIKNITFENEQKSFEYLFSQKHQFKSGKHKIEFYHEGVLIGEKTFMIK